MLWIDPGSTLHPRVYTDLLLSMEMEGRGVRPVALAALLTTGVSFLPTATFQSMQLFLFLSLASFLSSGLPTCQVNAILFYTRSGQAGGFPAPLASAWGTEA